MWTLLLVGFGPRLTCAEPATIGNCVRPAQARFPAPIVAASTPAMVTLGRLLFYDRALSVNEQYACASCHQQARAFTDGLPVAVGATGEHHHRNTPTLANVVYASSLGWANDLPHELAAQHRVPLTGTHPLEMGISESLSPALAMRFAKEPHYQAAVTAAYGSGATLDLDRITLAIAAFVGTLISDRAPFDEWVYDDHADRLSAAARRGMDLFQSSRLHCADCHRGFNVSGPVRTATHQDPPAFHNTGLSKRYADRGAGNGRFRAPTLRNIAVTAPYMHDGSLLTLDAVLDHYARGGEHARHQAKEVSGFALTSDERADLLAFLYSLTDRCFLADPAYGDPWVEDAAPESPDALGVEGVAALAVGAGPLDSLVDAAPPFSRIFLMRSAVKSSD